MKNQNSYVPPPYLPLGQSDSEADVVPRDEGPLPSHQTTTTDGPAPWSSGICACCDDMQSCCVGLFCPCYLFGKNAEFLGSGTLIGSCTTHFILWALVNTVCCCMTDGILLGLPGCFVSCYACGYRRVLREKYNLQEAPCGDFMTHFFCHLCANCQEYREIHERTCDTNPTDLKLPEVAAPQSRQWSQVLQSSSTMKLLKGPALICFYTCTFLCLSADLCHVRLRLIMLHLRQLS